MSKTIELNFHERNAAIRAYSSAARDTFERGAMVDAIIAAINTERAAPTLSTDQPCMYCDAPVKAKGLCNTHYTRKHRTGNPLPQVGEHDDPTR